MDFLEIRRKAKERAAAAARATGGVPEPAARATAPAAVPPEDPAGASGAPPVPQQAVVRSAAPPPLQEPPVLSRVDAALAQFEATASTLEVALPRFEPAKLDVEPPEAATADDDFGARTVLLPDGDAPPPDPDFSRLEPFEAIVKAVQAAGGELTPISDLPPWSDALTALPPDLPEERRDDGALHSAVWNAMAQPAPSDPLDDFFYREDESVPGLPTLDLGASAPPVAAEAADPRREYLTFRLGDEEYAIEIDRVREVLKAPVITDVPRAPMHVLGVIMVRGDVIAVFDPRRRLGLPPAARAPSPRVLVCDDGLGPIGLLVDTVSQVVRLRRSDIEPRPQGIGGVSAEYISGIGRQAGRMFIVLDLPVVLRGKAAESAEAA